MPKIHILCVLDETLNSPDHNVSVENYSIDNLKNNNFENYIKTVARQSNQIPVKMSYPTQTNSANRNMLALNTLLSSHTKLKKILFELH